MKKKHKSLSKIGRNTLMNFAILIDAKYQEYKALNKGIPFERTACYLYFHVTAISYAYRSLGKLKSDLGIYFHQRKKEQLPLFPNLRSSVGIQLSLDL